MNKLWILVIPVISLFQVQYLFASGDTLSITPDWQLTGLVSEGFASGVAWVDVNGDGFDDMVIGCPDVDLEVYNQGLVRVYLSDGVSIPTVYDQQFTEISDFERFGDEIRRAGDVNNDGYEDVLITGYDDTYSRGKVFLYFGSESGIDTVQVWHIDVSHDYSTVPVNMFSGFDVNKDGYDDVIISDLQDNNTEIDEGSSKLYLGSVTGLSLTDVWSAYGGENDAYFGNEVSVGDINHDTWLDIAVSEEGVNNGVGRAEIFFGGFAGFSLIASLVKYEAYDGEEFGDDIDISGDLNNDGFNDLVISVGNRVVGNYTNAIEIYYGPILTEIGSPDTILVCAAFNEGTFGSALRVADFLHDGFDDIFLRTFYKNGDDYNFAIISVTEAGIGSFPEWMTDNTDAVFTGIDISGDYNGDSLPDIAAWNTAETAAIYTGKHNFPGIPLLALTYFTGYNMDEEYFGKVISCSGDINNDGVNDMVSGNPFESDPSGEEGRLFYYKGKFPEADANFSWSHKLFQTGAHFGQSVEIIRDFDSDGFDDVFVGSPDYDYAVTDDGYIGLFKGKINGISNYPSWVVIGSETDRGFGYSVTTGDINGDGNTDFIVAAPNQYGAVAFTSRVYIYFGNGGIPDAVADIILQHDGAAGFGNKVATGDVNADGYSDVLVSEGFDYNDHPAKVWLYYGAAAMDTTADWSYLTLVETDDYEEWISMDGDFNNDGFNDIVIGNPSYTNGQSLEGCVSIFNGSATIPSLTPDKIIESDIINMKIGSAFTAGDLNGDGFDELSIGYPEYDLPSSNCGLIKIFEGKASGITDDMYAEISGFGSTYTGRTIAYSADADGDSIGDLFVGHWFTSYSSHGYITMHKGKKSECALVTDTIGTIVNDTSISITWIDIAPVVYNIRIRAVGTLDWQTITTTSSSAVFSGLEECKTFEVQLNAECTDASGPWITFFLSTTGCPLPCDLVEIPSLTVLSVTGSTASITWEEPEEALSYYVRFKPIASTAWIEFALPVNMIILTTLTACTDYEVQIKSDCGVDTSYWSDSYLFTTLCGGCLTPPGGLYTTHITSSSAKLHWTADPGASKYKVYYKPTGGPSWIIVNAHSNFRTLPGLTPSTSYQYKVKSLCAVGVESAFSSVASFTTLPLREGAIAEVSLFVNPTPNHGDFTIQFDGFADQSVIRIFNSIGQIIYQTDADDSNSAYISLQGTASGLYFVEVNDMQSRAIQTFIIN